MMEEAIPTEMVQLCINTLKFDKMTPEEQVCSYFTRNKLKKLQTWNKWKAGEAKQIKQFGHQTMFGAPVNPVKLPDNVVILCLYWQYLVKWSGVCHSCMCCNGSKVVAPQLHAITNS